MANKRISKSELVKMLSEREGIPVVRAERYLNAYLDIITSTLKDGGSAQLSGFGTFYVKSRAARRGVNPVSLKKMKIKAKNAPAFKAGERLKKSVE